MLGLVISTCMNSCHFNVKKKKYADKLSGDHKCSRLNGVGIKKLSLQKLRDSSLISQSSGSNKPKARPGSAPTAQAWVKLEKRPILFLV